MKRKSYRGEMHEFWIQRKYITEYRGLLLKEEKIIVPENFKGQILERVHRGHQGGERCYRRVRESIWWPGMRNDILLYVEGCNICIKNRKMRHLPLKNNELPTLPWEAVGSDLFEFRGRDYLVMVDYYSRWLEIVELTDKTAEVLIRKTMGIFSRLGFPKELRSDNGGCFVAESFKSFLSKYHVKHTTSSSRYPESNGLEEREECKR